LPLLLFGKRSDEVLILQFTECLSSALTGYAERREQLWV
jgi:hypothetical protein